MHNILTYIFKTLKSIVNNYYPFVCLKLFASYTRINKCVIYL